MQVTSTYIKVLKADRQQSCVIAFKIHSKVGPNYIY